ARGGGVMSAGRPVDNDSAAARLARRIDQLCDRFEAAWQAGRRPRLEHYLGKIQAAEQPELLRELLVLELDYRQRSGEQPQSEEYRCRFPPHAALIETLFKETRPTTASTPYLLPRWAVNRLLSQMRLLAFP